MSGALTDIEKRRYPRYVFTLEERVKGFLVFSNGTRLEKKATIMDISRNGVGLALSQKEKETIHEGDQLLLERLFALDDETWIKTDLTIRIIWVLEHPFLHNIGFGCEFQNPSSASLYQLVGFINSVFPERIDMGQQQSR
ncbi:MAG: PilZ domain-containing protein [Pseudomonadota bacterium]